jgi:hypothetical protein
LPEKTNMRRHVSLNAELVSLRRQFHTP